MKLTNCSEIKIKAMNVFKWLPCVLFILAEILSIADDGKLSGFNRYRAHFGLSV